MKNLFGLFVFVFSLSGSATSYPDSYYYQKLRISSKGPALVAVATAGSLGNPVVIGYKKSGFLSAGNPNSIKAVVLASCNASAKTTIIELGKEWHGNGYVTAQMDSTQLLPSLCYLNPGYVITRMELAFFDANGNWDSDYSQNFLFDSNTLYGGAVQITGSTQNGQINLESWRLIVEALGR